jgi:hypothetical protein
MKEQKKTNEIDFRVLLIIGIIILIVGLGSLSRNTDFGAAMIMGGFVLSLISILKLLKNKKVKNVMSSAWWFLVAGIVFGFSGIRYIVKQDTVGAIINLVAAILFFVVFIGHARKKR